ncbi:hypothetical protein ACFQS7_23230 [Dankookia sp. GCM10030260]|uniref:hypothetical protein n=1 Tax=Dankookia sp. GCM10030260 TaxID=3273390 RepID=UPI0036158E05
MAVSRLFDLRPTPTGLHDPAWALSRYRGECRVIAESPDQARRFADGAFLLPMRDSLAGQACRSPWQQAALVEVVTLPAYGARSHRRRGEVWCIAPAFHGGA